MSDTLKSVTINYCNEIIESLKKMVEAKKIMDEFLGDDKKKRTAFNTMVEHDQKVKELFEEMEVLTNKLEM